MLIEKMTCPKCECPLTAEFNHYQDDSADYCEIFFTCTNDHHYFTRVKQEDLIDEN